MSADAKVWVPVLYDDGFHVIPVNDLIEHDLTDSCPCGPNDQAVIADNGSIDWITVHASLDGREQNE